MPDALLPHFLTRWRLPLLALAILVIVVAPFLLLRVAAERSVEAASRVSHTLEVEAGVRELVGYVRNIESAALSLAHGVDTPVLRERIADSRTRIGPVYEHVLLLTRDNPEQLVRLGALRSTMDRRLENIERVIARGPGSTRGEIEAAVGRYPIQRLADTVVAEERRLLAARESDAARTQRQATLLNWSAMLAQLVLLGIVSFFASRAIAQRLRAEVAQRGADARARAVLDAVREPIALVDDKLQVVLRNAAFEELYGGDGDAMGPLADIGGGAWRDEGTLRRLGDVVARGRELWDHEQPQRTADGIDRTMLINARRMPLPDSEARAVLISASDITVQKASERHIRELNRQLEGKVEQVTDVNRELEAFSYSVSHDLRAPLRHIAGFADKLGRHLGDGADERALHYLGVIGSSARRMSTLIDDLLVYSRLGRSAMRLQTVDMQSVVQEVRAMLDAGVSSDQPGHRVDWTIAPLPVVVGDDNMLRQVWQNLLGNAVKYSARSEPARIEVTHRIDAEGAHAFTVRDNGAGFDMAYAGKLFGVFQRLHSANDFPGTGIGLASVRRVLARHGGRVWAESAPGQGATFHFTLPAHAEQAHLNERAA